MSREIQILPNADRLAEVAAEMIVAAAAASVAARGRFTLVLSGGRTPEATYALLTSPEWIGQLPWDKTFLFFGDERFVPPDDSRSNFHMARQALLSRAPIAADHVLPIPTNLSTPAECAAEYARQLAKFFGPQSSAPPSFDLVLLGLGDDGHTASLFPGAAALAEQQAWVTSSPPGVLPPPVDRITLTFPVLNAARQIVFLVAGAGKGKAARAVLLDDPPVQKRPAAGVRPTQGTVTWLLDQAAAALMNAEQ